MTARKTVVKVVWRQWSRSLGHLKKQRQKQRGETRVNVQDDFKKHV